MHLIHHIITIKNMYTDHFTFILHKIFFVQFNPRFISSAELKDKRLIF